MNRVFQKAFDIGQAVWFIASPINNCYIYSRFEGVVADLHEEAGGTVYYIRPTKILETHAHAQAYINGDLYLSRIGGRVKERRIYGIGGGANSEMCVPMPHVFHTPADMETGMREVNAVLMLRLGEIANILEKRICSL